MSARDGAGETMDISSDAPAIDFREARESADRISKEKLKDPLLLAWYDGAAGKGHPDVHECTGKPGWQAYAESRGGVLTINVNDGQYIFIYAETS